MTDSKSSLALVKLCCIALEEKKADDVRVLDVAEQSSITNFLVVATATSAPHLRALRVELEKVLDGGGVHIVGIESPQESGWTVIDAFDVMLHLFLPEFREKYRLESLWKDAAEIPVDRLLKTEVPKKRARMARPKKRAIRRPKK